MTCARLDSIPAFVGEMRALMPKDKQKQPEFFSMVGEVVLGLLPEIKSLRKGAGKNAPLKPKGNFAPSPHRDGRCADVQAA
jgi:hypothetical protein